MTAKKEFKEILKGLDKVIGTKIELTDTENLRYKIAKYTQDLLLKQKKEMVRKWCSLPLRKFAEYMTTLGQKGKE